VHKIDDENGKTRIGYYNVVNETFSTSIKYIRATPFPINRYGIAQVQLPNGKKMAIDKWGKEVIPSELFYNILKQVSEEHLLVNATTNSKGIYNIKEKTYTVPLGKYSVLKKDDDYLVYGVGVKVNTPTSSRVKYGLIDNHGKEIIPLQFDKIIGFVIGDFVKNGLVEVVLNGKKGFVDITGRNFFEE